MQYTDKTCPAGLGRHPLQLGPVGQGWDHLDDCVTDFPVPGWLGRRGPRGSLPEPEDPYQFPTTPPPLPHPKKNDGDSKNLAFRCSHGPVFASDPEPWRTAAMNPDIEYVVDIVVSYLESSCSPSNYWECADDYARLWRTVLAYFGLGNSWDTFHTWIGRTVN